MSDTLDNGFRGGMNAVFALARVAYMNMRDDMAPKLERAIKVLEPVCYTAVDPQRRKLEPSRLGDVLQRASKRNDEWAIKAGFQ